MVLALSMGACSVVACSGVQRVSEAELEQADYHFQLAIGHWRAGENPLALRELQQALEIHPEHIDALHLWGFIYMGRRDYEEAELYFQRALEVDDERWDIHNNLGTVYLAQERWEAAAEIFRMLSRVPTYETPAHAYNNLGWAQFNLGLTRDALANFQLATEFGPDHCKAWNNLGLAWEELGNMPEARRAWEVAVDLSVCDTFAEPYYHLGVAVLDLDGDLPRAQELFDACVEAEPGSSVSRRCEEYLAAIGPPADR